MNTFYKQLLIALFMSTTTFAASNTPLDENDPNFGFNPWRLVTDEPVAHHDEEQVRRKELKQTKIGFSNLEISKPTDCEGIVHQLSKRPSLTHVYFTNCIGIDKCFTYDTLFSNNPEVTILSLKSCGLTYNSMLSYLGSKIRSLPKLSSLDLTGNRINDQGLILLAQILKGHVHNLVYVTLTGNNVTVEGKRTFLEILNSERSGMPIYILG